MSEARPAEPARPPGPVAVLPAADERRGVTVVLDVPSGDGYPDDVELLALADVLLELARDLVPGAATRTQVTLGRA